MGGQQLRSVAFAVSMGSLMAACGGTPVIDGPDPRFPVPEVTAPADGRLGAEAEATGRVATADVVISRQRRVFRRCFEQFETTGEVAVDLLVVESGDVARVTPRSGDDVPRGVLRCVVERARALHFDAPTGGAARVPLSVVVLDQ